MKIRAIGTGSAFCRHPLVTTSFLIQSENSNVLIGCGPNIPAKLETINLSLAQIDMFVLLNYKMEQIGGLEETIHLLAKGGKKPYLVGPGDLLKAVSERFKYPVEIAQAFEVRSVNKITINEEHFSETMVFIPTYLTLHSPSYALQLEEAEIFISGTAELNDEFLHRYGMPAELILHQGFTPGSSYPSWAGMGTSIEDLKTLPIYLQKKIWVCGYGNDYLEIEEPIPMLFLPQGTCVFDSDRKEKHLDKERFIRENSKRQLGNITALSSQ